MRRRASQNAGPVVTLVVVFALAMTLIGPSAAGHPGLNTGRWPSGKRITYNYTASVDRMPGGSRESIEDAVREWNKLGGNVSFRPGRTVANYSTDSCPATDRNAVHYRRIDGPSHILGSAQWCVSAGKIVTLNVVFDTSETWHTSSGSPPTGTVDLRAVATHEFGHGLGFSHFESGDSVCQDSSIETMCPYYSPLMRDPDPHDIHRFTGLYGGSAP